MKKFAILLAGCGRLDGSEIHESVLTLLALSQLNASYQCFSLDLPQYQVVNHLTEKVLNSLEVRNQLIESARIARGNILDLKTININDYAGLIIPGGNGTAYNLFDLAIQGENFKVEPEVIRVANEFTKANKPVGFICISPVMIPKIYNSPVKLTIGNDPNTASLINKLGGIHIDCPVNSYVLDEKYKIISTPAYMLAKNINEVYLGISSLVRAMFELA